MGARNRYRALATWRTERTPTPSCMNIMHRARASRLPMEPFVATGFNTALVRSQATRLAQFIPTHPLALLALRGAQPCALQDKDRRAPWAGGMLEAADRRGRSSAAHVRSCSGLERRGERSARALRVLYGLRLLEMAALERFCVRADGQLGRYMGGQRLARGSGRAARLSGLARDQRGARAGAF